MYFEDLSLCQYHRGPLDADSWRVPLRAVGWLETGHAFHHGATPPGLVAKLGVLIEGASSVFAQYHFRGLHDCTLCSPGPQARLQRSHINLLVPSRLEVFACPAAIVHYLEVHSYLPPASFVDATLQCPQYGSSEYFAALQEANQGYAVPLVTWEKYLSESRKQTEEIIRQRELRLKVVTYGHLSPETHTRTTGVTNGVTAIFELAKRL
ncbi:MAG TPA: hypothetical protein VGI90_19265 [Steroidobacteraceae bacterium]|jgi:hypothetical protein